MRIQQYISVQVRETGIAYGVDARKKFNSPDRIVEFLTDKLSMHTYADEHVCVLCLDTQCKLTGFFEASCGSVNGSLFPVREIFQKALLLGAASIIVAHNHPSGDTMPSANDIAATKRAKTAGDILGVPVLDHIIIGDGYTSFQEQGLI